MRPANDFPFRAVGGNVLLRKVVVDTGKLLHAGVSFRELRAIGEVKTDNVLQIGEILGLGGRWTQDAPWWPPIPVMTKARHAKLIDESNVYQDRVDPNWKAPDLTHRARKPQTTRFSAVHKARLEDLQVGDLVVYNSARTYDFFAWEGNSIIVYPGCWIHAVIEDSYLTRNPDARRQDELAV